MEYAESNEIKEKKAKNLLWVSIISIIMLFAGFTSAYIVIAGDNFWVDIRLPYAFVYSTIAVAAGSGTLYLALRFIKNSKTGQFNLMMWLTLIMGALFGYFQYSGWSDLFKRGNAVVGNLSAEGRYGLYFSYNYREQPVVFDGNKFYVEDRPLTEEDLTDMKEISASIADVKVKEGNRNYPMDMKGFTLMFKNQSVQVVESGLFVAISDSLVSLTYDQRLHLTLFARNVKDGRGDFVMMGNYGEDFTILYRGEPLAYENRKLLKPGGTELSKAEYALLKKSRNTSSSFIYILTGLHLLHFAGGIIYLLRLMTGVVKRKFSENNYLNIKIFGIYWHFLGILWVYLYLFLSFIH